MASKREVEYDSCPACAGSGKLPGAGTGAVLRAEREAAGVSLALAASAMEISSAYLGDLERGNRDWSNMRVEQFRRVLKEVGNND